MPRLLVIDDRDQTVEMVHRQLPEFDTVTRCDRAHPLPGVRGARRAAARCAARTTMARRPRRWRGWTRCPTWSCSICTSRCPRSGCCPRTSRACPREPKAAARRRSSGLRRRQGLLILEQAARELPDAAGGHADDDRLGPGRGAARRSAGLPLRERGGRQPQPGRRDLARARRCTTARRRGRIFWGRAPAMAELRRAARRARALAAAGARSRARPARARASSPSTSSTRARAPRGRWW